MFSPREVYVIDVECGDLQDPTNLQQTPHVAKDKLARLCAQKLVRALLLAGSQRFQSYGPLDRFSLRYKRRTLRWWTY